MELCRSRWPGGLRQADDVGGMGIFSTTTGAADGLTAEDRADFITLDAVVRRGVEAARAVMEAGKALAEIRDRQLFRAVVGSWDEYVTGRHGMTRRRADQLIAAAATLEAVKEAVHQKTGTTVPALRDVTERTARELVGMDASQAAEAVLEAAASPDGLTAATVRKAARKRRKLKAAKAPRPRRYRVPGGIVTVSLNRKSNGSFIDALAAALRQAEEQLEAENHQAEAA